MLGIVHLVLLLQKDLIELLDIYLKGLFLKRVMVIGLMIYKQKQNNIIIEYIHRLKRRRFKVVLKRMKDLLTKTY